MGGPTPFAAVGRALLDRPALATIALAALALFIIFAHLGEGHLANYDDCYYAQKAKEMIRGGDWITPHYDGLPALDNPPLFLWVIAGSFLALGVRDYAAILGSALSGVLSVLLLHRIALRLRLGAFPAWCAAFVLLTTQYFLKYSRHAMFDVFLTLLFLLAIASYLRARDSHVGAWGGVGLFSGLGVLTKSVLGFFPLAVIALHLAWTGRARELARPRFLLAPIVALATIAPWYLYELAAHGPQFREEHIGWLLLQRGLSATSGEAGWTNYLGYFRDLATLYWPWLPAAAAGVVIAIRRARRGPEGDAPKLVLLWLLVVIGVMSVGREKKLWYIMTAFPALALASSLALERWLRSDAARGRAVAGSAAVLAALALWLDFGPVSHSGTRQPGLYEVARVASATVPPGARVANYDNGYWSIENLFFFYSDHSLAQQAGADSVRAAMDRGSFALVASRRVGEILRAGSGPARYRVVARSGDWALMSSGAPVPATVPPVDPYR